MSGKTHKITLLQVAAVLRIDFAEAAELARRAENGDAEAQRLLIVAKWAVIRAVEGN